MAEPYAELCLYYASCTDSVGLGSGKLVLDKTSPVAQERYQEAMKVAMRAVDSQTNGEFPWHLGYIGHGTVQDEASALRVIDYADLRIHNSHGIIKLDKIYHAMIFFERKLRLDGFTQDKKRELVRKLQRSGQFNGVRTLEEALKFF